MSNILVSCAKCHTCCVGSGSTIVELWQAAMQSLSTSWRLQWLKGFREGRMCNRYKVSTSNVLILWRGYRGASLQGVMLTLVIDPLSWDWDYLLSLRQNSQSIQWACVFVKSFSCLFKHSRDLIPETSYNNFRCSNICISQVCKRQIDFRTHLQVHICISIIILSILDASFNSLICLLKADS